ncbi:MAG TPA: hypothetical protein VGT61_03045 [Thermomicrobiales bacterium]|jgi:hypothetical protein|nr:hypothetical protein [Thermomicrobiales bacterium]
MADTPRRHRADPDQPEDIQQRFGTAVWVWTIGSGLLMLVLIILLVLSIGGFWQSDWWRPPV